MNLRRYIITSIVTIGILTLFVTGCGAKKDIPSFAVKYNPNWSDKELLMTINEVNQDKQFVDEGYYKGMNVNNLYQIPYSYCFGPDDTYYTSDSKHTEEYVVEPNESCGIIKYGKSAYIGDAKAVTICEEQFVDAVKNTDYLADGDVLTEGEVVISKKVENGILELETHSPAQEEKFEEYQRLGIDMTKPIGYIQSIATYDADSMILIEGKLSAFQEGDYFNYQIFTNVYGKTNPFDEDIKRIKEDTLGGVTHTIKIIVGAGTEREKEYVVTANEDAILDYWILDADDTYTIYEDPDYTVYYESEDGFIPFDTDKILYMK